MDHGRVFVGLAETPPGRETRTYHTHALTKVYANASFGLVNFA